MSPVLRCYLGFLGLFLAVSAQGQRVRTVIPYPWSKTNPAYEGSRVLEAAAALQTYAAQYRKAGGTESVQVIAWDSERGGWADSLFTRFGPQTGEWTRTDGLKVAWLRADGLTPARTEARLRAYVAEGADLIVALTLRPGKLSRLPYIGCIVTRGKGPGGFYRLAAPFGDSVPVIDLGRSPALAAVIRTGGNAPPSFSLTALTDYPPDRGFLSRWRSAVDSGVRRTGRPLFRLERTADPAEALVGPSAFSRIFHRFQLEATGADLSFFAPSVTGPPLRAGTVSENDLLGLFPYENRLCVIELTGAEIVRWLEYGCGKQFNRLFSPESDLLRVTTDSDGSIRTRYPVYHFDTAYGLVYTVDLTRPYGKRVRPGRLTDGRPLEPDRRYRVALNSFRAEGGGGYFRYGLGLTDEAAAERIRWVSEASYFTLLKRWLERQGTVKADTACPWRLLPVGWVRKAAEREFPGLLRTKGP